MWFNVVLFSEVLCMLVRGDQTCAMQLCPGTGIQLTGPISVSNLVSFLWHFNEHYWISDLAKILAILRSCYFFPQIALAIWDLTSSIEVRVRRFFGFVLSGRVSSGGVVNSWYLPMLFGVMKFWSCSAIENQISGFCPFLFTTWIKRCDACFGAFLGSWVLREMDDGCWVWWYRLGIVWHAGVTLQWWTCALAGVLRNQDQTSIIHIAKCCCRQD